MGIATARDSLVIDWDKRRLIDRITQFANLKIPFATILQTLFDGKDSKTWDIQRARELIANNHHEQFIQTISYRPFDKRYIYYNSDMIDRSREEMMKNFIVGPNLGICLIRINRDDHFSPIVVDHICPESVKLAP